MSPSYSRCSAALKFKPLVITYSCTGLITTHGFSLVPVPFDMIALIRLLRRDCMIAARVYF